MKDYIGKIVRQRRPKGKNGECRDTAKVTLVKHGIKRVYSLGRWGSPEAEQAYNQLMVQYYSDSLPVEPKQTAMVELFNDYLEHSEFPPMDKTRYRTKKVLRWCVELFGSTPCSSFSFATLSIIKERIVTDCRNRNLTQVYANQLLFMAKHIFTYGVLKGWLDGSVLPIIKAYPAITERLKPLKKRTAVPDEVVEATLKYMVQPYIDIIRLIRSACLRPSELLNIRKSDIEVKEDCWVIRVKSKTERFGYSRIIVFNQKEQEILKKYIRKDSEVLFYNSKGTPVRELNLGMALRVALRLAERRGEKIPKWTAYQLRHAAFTENVEKYGVEIASKLAGHANLNMAKIYDHSTEVLLIKLAQEARKTD